MGCLPHLVDGRHERETQSIDRERTTGLEARRTERKKCFRLVVVFAAAVRNAISGVGDKS